MFFATHADPSRCALSLWERATQNLSTECWVRGQQRPLTHQSTLRLLRCPLPQGRGAITSLVTCGDSLARAGHLPRALLALRDRVDPAQRIADGVRLRLQLARLVRPVSRDQRAVAPFGLAAQLPDQRDALLEGAQAGAERAAQAFVDGDAHHVGRIGVSLMAAEAGELAFVDLPHHAVAVRTGEDRAPADAIHVAHVRSPSFGDLALVFQAVRN